MQTKLSVQLRRLSFAATGAKERRMQTKCPFELRRGLARNTAGCRHFFFNFAAGCRERAQDADDFVFYLRRGLARKSAGCRRSYPFNFAAGWRERAQDADKNVFSTSPQAGAANPLPNGLSCFFLDFDIRLMRNHHLGPFGVAEWTIFGSPGQPGGQPEAARGSQGSQGGPGAARGSLGQPGPAGRRGRLARGGPGRPGTARSSRAQGQGGRGAGRVREARREMCCLGSATPKARRESEYFFSIIFQLSSPRSAWIFNYFSIIFQLFFNYPPAGRQEAPRAARPQVAAIKIIIQ